MLLPALSVSLQSSFPPSQPLFPPPLFPPHPPPNLINPVTRIIIALRDGTTLQISNLDLKAKMKTPAMPKVSVFLRGASLLLLVLGAATVVYHWSTEGATEHVKVFVRYAELGVLIAFVAAVVLVFHDKKDQPPKLFLPEIGRDKDAPGVPTPCSVQRLTTAPLRRTRVRLLLLALLVGCLAVQSKVVGAGADAVTAKLPQSSTGGLLGISILKGRPLQVAVNEEPLIPYIMYTRSDDELASALAGREGLPGADKLRQQKFERLFAMQMPAQPGAPQPVFQFFSTLIEKGKLNAIESIKLLPVLQQGRGNLLTTWLQGDKLECFELLGDLLSGSDLEMALAVYLRANSPEKAINCFAQRGEFDKFVAYAATVGYRCDYGMSLTQLLHQHQNPQSAVDFAKTPAEGGLIEPQQAVNICMSRVQECKAFLLDALKENKPNQGVLQTKILEMNLFGGSPQGADAIIANAVLTYDDKQYVAKLCEKAGLFQSAAELFAELSDIEVTAKFGQFKEVECVCRDSTVYDAVKVKAFLMEANLADPRPLIHFCDYSMLTKTLDDNVDQCTKLKESFESYAYLSTTDLPTYFAEFCEDAKTVSANGTILICLEKSDAAIKKYEEVLKAVQKFNSPSNIVWLRINVTPLAEIVSASVGEGLDWPLPPPSLSSTHPDHCCYDAEVAGRTSSKACGQSAASVPLADPSSAIQIADWNANGTTPLDDNDDFKELDDIEKKLKQPHYEGLKFSFDDPNGVLHQDREAQLEDKLNKSIQIVWGTTAMDFTCLETTFRAEDIQMQLPGASQKFIVKMLDNYVDFEVKEECEAQGPVKFWLTNVQCCTSKALYDAAADSWKEYRTHVTERVSSVVEDFIWTKQLRHYWEDKSINNSFPTFSNGTTKDVAKALAVYFVIFNCSDGLDFKFEGNLIPLKHSFGVFIMTNPGYAELPNNRLKVLFRPVVTMFPDCLIAEVVLIFSEGFSNVLPLFSKMKQLYAFASSEQISKQDFYDFGKMTIKSVLVAAGKLKRKKGLETVEVLGTLLEQHDHDLPLFFAKILSDLFPGIDVPYGDYGDHLQQIPIPKQFQGARDYVETWAKKISPLETLDAWLTRQLMYLETIFCAQEQLPSESQKESIIKHTHDTLRGVACIIDGGPIYLEKFQRAHFTLESVQKSRENYLDTKRMSDDPHEVAKDQTNVDSKALSFSW